VRSVGEFAAPLQISNGFASWQRYCTALKYWASAKLCGVEQRAPPIFGRAAITLGIGPHSSYECFVRLYVRARVSGLFVISVLGIFHMHTNLCMYALDWKKINENLQNRYQSGRTSASR